MAEDQRDPIVVMQRYKTPTAIIIFLILGIWLFARIIQYSFQARGATEKKATNNNTFLPMPSSTIMPSTTSMGEVTIEPEKTITTRRIVKGSTPKGIEFYEKVDTLRKQGRVNGELCTEFESDAIVDVNPKMQSVQMSLMYPSIIENVDDSDKALILNDFNVIKALAEQDPSLILSDYGTLRLFVLTFHDSSCIAKGELQKMMIDAEPQWIDWK
ncbi:hypothetical protein A3A79_02490 [Candidatus Gottesmanbacteria bacterium RIFCSPLOWO2_01_FULL_43_11b]|uniref:Uncharacterized protein n=1 Tax=Candidatus Gottesmanbacteria bacterium RIFCSPLOWO2_01_FULL_43_11b TaxID=1798392 RepID=A0A1F6AH82_9BACT|nr:MAG: hypothetical protein A3A79_02490 [Candidatus Gottesmanbacteria bacterium RIFCSPLOWO2_01_FULL_43_11b]